MMKLAYERTTVSQRCSVSPGIYVPDIDSDLMSCGEDVTGAPNINLRD
jgi:hypothetical protein